MSDCIDLKERFGHRLRIGIDESYFASSGSTKNCNRDPWNWILRGSRGHICPWGGDLLALCLNAGHTGLAARLLREPWVNLDRSQVGDDGVNAVFHVDDIQRAAEYARLYVRRQLSEGERDRLARQLQVVRKRRQIRGLQSQNAIGVAEATVESCEQPNTVNAPANLQESDK